MANSNGTITVKSKSLNTQAKYENEEKDLYVDNLSIAKDALTNTLTRTSGDFNRISDKTWVGRFTGMMSDGTMKYDISGVSLDDIAAVKACIADIEAQVNAEN